MANKSIITQQLITDALQMFLKCHQTHMRHYTYIGNSIKTFIYILLSWIINKLIRENVTVIFCFNLCKILIGPCRFDSLSMMCFYILLYTVIFLIESEYFTFFWRNQ